MLVKHPIGAIYLLNFGDQSVIFYLKEHILYSDMQSIPLLFN